ncbi:MAG: acetate--CoA ligase family protein [Rhodospirillaceae bacterium]|nr:acetate--CoA ligase family protein [Rhodospirillaceae bacterium]
MDDPKALLGLLRPKSIAVIGGKEAAEVIRQCDKLGFEGDIWPVNLRQETMEGRPCFKKLEDLPAPPDAAFIAIPANPTIEAVGILSSMGAGGAVCYASGFKEVGGVGYDLQEDLIKSAADMPIIGPNCYGVLNYLDGAALWPDQHGGVRVKGGVAIITQSGNIGLNLTMQTRGLELAYLISLGNQAMVSIEHCVEALLKDSRVTAIGLHIEGLADISAFESAALKATRKGVPMVALKSGRSEQGARIALSHTASLVGEDGLYDAFFERLGIARSHAIPEFIETLKFLSLAGPLKGNKIVSMSCSGGEASLVADLAKDLPLAFPEIEGAHKTDIRATLNEYVSISNPLDYHTFIWADEQRMTDCFTAVMQGGYNTTLLVLDFPRQDRCDAKGWETACKALINAARATGHLAAVVTTLPECMDENTALLLSENGVVPLYGITDALIAITAAVKLGHFFEKSEPRPLIPPTNQKNAIRTLDEWRSKRLLSTWGIPSPSGSLVQSETEAVAAAEALGYPVAVKAVSANIAHKTEKGGVALNVSDGDGVYEAAEIMLGLSDTLLIETMVDDAVAELIVGIDQDAQFGAYLVVGFGGVLVELIGDSCSFLLPTDRNSVITGLRSLKVSALFDGYRGRPEGDFDASVDAILAVARFVEDNPDKIEEIDINPLMIRPHGKGVVAADAFIRMREGN